MQKNILFLLLTITTLTMSQITDDLRTLWNNWKLTYNKTYTPSDDEVRFDIFCDNYNTINQWNSVNENVKLALNKFADKGAEEFTNLHANCYLETGSIENNIAFLDVLSDSNSESDITLPASVDWRTQGAVTPVKDQKSCNGCSAFSAVGALESLYFIKNNKLEIFSEQQVIDCDMNSVGCEGGRPDSNFAYTMQAGLELDTDYPFVASTEDCYADKTKAYKVNTNYKLLLTRNPQALKAAIVKQPVSVALQADPAVFQFYTSGVINQSCGDDLNFVGLVVGYDTINGEEAFIVKISWGADWGQEGYIYLSTDISLNDGNGACGILSLPVFPTI